MCTPPSAHTSHYLHHGLCLACACPNSPIPCPAQVVTDLEEAVYDADIVINSLPSTDCGKVFERISTIWSSRAPGRMPPVVVSLSKGVEFVEQPSPHIVTPTRIMHHATGIPLENLLYLGGPNIAAEVWEGEYATARLCGAKKWRVPLSKFFRTSSFVVWRPRN
mmetsp:Transcript_6372/g.21935  ORF Transcript_6372/g.21935 Transcript_6372/m.21935 type:complete len:164 (+) Transcript_6372:547-1038(+)